MSDIEMLMQQTVFIDHLFIQYILQTWFLKQMVPLLFSHLRNVTQAQPSMSKEPLGTEISSFLNEAGCLLST